MSERSITQLRRVIELACLAPSVHNTQPWLWRVAGQATIELYADRSRQLPVSDPDGRNMAISCGAALHHAIEASRCLGLVPHVELTPDAEDPDLLARIRLSSGRRPPDADTRLATLRERCTDRRRFTAWPIPDVRLHKLAEAASGWGALAVPIVDVSARFRAELLLERSMTQQATDPRFADEQELWIEHTGTDGIPITVATPPTAARGRRPSRFVSDTAPTQMGNRRVVESSDGLIAICSAYDDQTAWLQTGEALSALWLSATRNGLSIVPLSQVIEVSETREALRHDILASLARPQILVRVGWQEIARATLPRTPRRPLDDVLMR